MMTADEYNYLEKRWKKLYKQEIELAKQLEQIRKERNRIGIRLADEIIVEDEN